MSTTKINYPKFETQESRIEDLLSGLNYLNDEIARSLRDKELVESKLLELIMHPVEGQATSIHGKYSVTISSPINYKLNLDQYHIFSDSFKEPIAVPEVVYKVNKKYIRDLKAHGSAHDLELLNKIIVEQPGKKSIKVSSRIR